eukprot:2209264-Pyramimonas_sp.AAC.2
MPLLLFLLIIMPLLLLLMPLPLLLPYSSPSRARRRSGSWTPRCAATWTRSSCVAARGGSPTRSTQRAGELSAWTGSEWVGTATHQSSDVSGRRREGGGNPAWRLRANARLGAHSHYCARVRRRPDPNLREMSHETEDLCTLGGMLAAVRATQRLKVGGLLWASPECKTWLNMGMFHTRCAYNNIS